MTQRSPWMRWTWGLSVTGMFAWSWLILWGLIPGTPAADEVAVDAAVRFSIERESESGGPLAVVLYGFDPVHRKDLETIGSLTLRESGGFHSLGQTPNVRRLRIMPDEKPAYPRRSFSLKEVGQLQQLEAFTCSYTGIRRLTEFPSLPHLTDFSARNTAITSLEGLSNAPALTSVDVGIYSEPNSASYPAPYNNGPEMLEHSRFHPLEIYELKLLSRLEILSLRGRGQQYLQVIPELTELTHLDLGQNELESLEGIQQLVKLQTLSVDRNNIRDLSPLLLLPSLQTATLMGNPATPENLAVFDALEAKGVFILDSPRKRRGQP